MVVLVLVLALLAVPAFAHDGAAAQCGGGGVNHGTSQVPPPPDDLDCDFVKDTVDNCPPIGYDDIRTRNPDQEDADDDGVGDWCQADDDADGIFDWTDHEIEYGRRGSRLDNCRTVDNPGQEDDNGNGVGNACEFDSDGDGLFDSEDNCPSAPNPDQADLEGDDFGDVCDNDDDGDYSRDSRDNCPRYPNPDQLDADQDAHRRRVRRQRHAGAGARDPDADAGRDRQRDRPPAAAGDGLRADLAAGGRGRRRADRARPLLGGVHGEGRAEGVQGRSRAACGCAAPRSSGPGLGAHRGRDEHLRVRALQLARSRPAVQALPHGAHAEGHRHRSGREHPA